MKELSIEEKAYDGNYKAYTELINRLEYVKDAIKKQNYGIAIDVLCKPYPDFQVTTHSELKESEERIELLNYLYDVHDDDEERARWIAWLEKQGEQNLVNTDLDELVIQLEETIGTSPHSRETIKDFFQKAVQKYMNCLRIANGEIGRLVDENYSLKEKQGEQKDICKTCGFRTLACKQKPAEWSEEDENIIRLSIENLTELEDRYGKEYGKVGDCIDWLESLKPQEQWKPSKEQMDALNYVVNLMASSERPTENDLYYNILKSLRQQLKKLKS